ncbi:hypothetical protein D3C73_17630 [compost metagenome]
MPLAESIERRSEPRDKKYNQTEGRYRLPSKGFDLSKVYFVAHKIPLEAESRFTYVKYQGDRMVHAMLDAHIDHCLHQMVLSGIQSYDSSPEELTTEEEMERFALHLVARRAVLVSERMLGAFSSLLREERLAYPHSTKDLAEYIVRCFNDKQPLTKKVVAFQESGEVIIMLADAQKSGDHVS